MAIQTLRSANPPSPLRRRRLVLGLRMQDVADASGISRQSIGLFELGKLHPGRSTQILLAHLLDAERADLFPTEP